jgi:peptide/nickel transport system ATP-binding protein
MNSAKSLCEDICIIKDGNMVEYGKMHEILKTPKEKYTQTLINANFANREFRQ